MHLLFDFGWYEDEALKLFEVSFLWAHENIGMTLFHIQIAKFCFGIIISQYNYDELRKMAEEKRWAK